jgi:hypothetical protein
MEKQKQIKRDKEQEKRKERAGIDITERKQQFYFIAVDVFDNS